MADIILGSDAISRPNASPAGYTYIYLANPAAVDGWITSFQVYFHTAPTLLKIGLFYLLSGSTWRCRNSITVESIPSGFYTIDGLVMEVRAGDHIGFWHQGGTLARHDSGGTGARYISGEYADPGDEASFSLISYGRIISVRGIGSTDFIPPASLDSLTEDLFDDLNPVFKGYPQPVYDYSLNASNSEDEVTLTATLDGATTKYTYGSVVDKVVASGVGETIPLALGANMVTITVEKPGYETTTYTVTITRIGIVDWEYIRPNGDSSVSLKIYPASPSTHYDKVREQSTPTQVYWDLAWEAGDLWSFGNPVQREKPDVKKVRIFAVGFRNNPLAWGKFAVYTNGALYKGPQNTWGGYQSPGSEYYTLTSNPITGNPWTLDEIDALLAGEYHFDSGIPSRVGSYWYYLSVVYENASVRTEKATAYTGTSVTLHGAVTNTEGTFLDPYTPLGDNLLRVRFEWGETTAYGNTTAYQMGITGAFSANLSGLDPVKIYHYRAVVEVRADSRVGGFDVYYGEDMIFPSKGGPVSHSIADRLASEGAI